MGTYLSTPVMDKCEESGESLECPDVPCSWGVVDMQGWRKSMEDAHLAVTNLSLPDANDDTSSSTISTSSDAKVFGVFDGHGGAEVARLCGLYLVSVLTQQETWNGNLTAEPAKNHLDGVEAGETKVGKALRCSFHALDRMVDDVSRREEIMQLRNMKPQTGERRDAVSIPDPLPVEGKAPLATKTPELEPMAPLFAEEEKSADASSSESDQTETPTEPVATKGDNADANAVPEVMQQSPRSSEEVEEETGDDGKADDDSDDVVGKEEAAEQDQDMMDDGDGEHDEDVTIEVVDPSEPANVTTMFQKILSLGAQGAGQVMLQVGGKSATPAAPPTPPSALVSGPSASQPTIIQNGRMICNLPDYPIHAGATAIVAVFTGRILTVANAGDSRAVLCRAEGVTLPLSFDHKPQQEREMSRITNAGGFVNHFGRVNGNLNLSRSIGDLKYKQVPGIAPPDQMITSEPDIIQVALEPGDEFLILGCDGIWDCLTNENAVEYVRQRIGSKSLTEIGAEMLDEIVSEDPRVTQGIGGDNMTIMIIDLQPQSRNIPSPTVEEEEAPPSPSPAEAELGNKE